MPHLLFATKSPVVALSTTTPSRVPAAAAAADVQCRVGSLAAVDSRLIKKPFLPTAAADGITRSCRVGTRSLSPAARCDRRELTESDRQGSERQIEHIRRSALWPMTEALGQKQRPAPDRDQRISVPSGQPRSPTRTERSDRSVRWTVVAPLKNTHLR